MNKKKLLPLVMSLVLVGAVAVGATLAYFTDSEQTTNIITMGNVDIDLTEPGFDTEDGEDDNTITDITPGQEIVKDPTITVAEDSADSYVRATIEITGLNDEAQKAELLAGIAIENGWILADGYYYYQQKVISGDSIVLFKTVTIPEKWGNEVANATFQIIVSAEAIQADNFNPYNSNGEIVAWNYADGTAITVENYEEESVSNGEIQ